MLSKLSLRRWNSLVASRASTTGNVFGFGVIADGTLVIVNGPLDPDTKLYSVMVGGCQDLKILKSIIKPIAVNVMDMFITLKWTVNFLFGYYSMLISPFVRIGNLYLPVIFISTQLQSRIANLFIPRIVTALFAPVRRVLGNKFWTWAIWSKLTIPLEAFLFVIQGAWFVATTSTSFLFKFFKSRHRELLGRFYAH